MLDKQTLREFALSEGVDLVGFAGIERFENAPAEFHPHNIFPRAKTAVVLAIRVLRGLMDSLDNGLYLPYNAHGYGGINEKFMRHARQSVACFIEDHGFTAMPVIQWTGTPHQEPIMCHRTAAVAAGLGQFGWSKVFLSPQFGPLQRFGIILTDAELPSDPLFTGDLCDGCKACVKACPAAAISADEADEWRVGDHVYRHGKVDMYRCTRAHGGSLKDTHPRCPADFDVSDIDARYEELLADAADDVSRYVLGYKAVGEVLERYPHPLFGLVGSLAQSCAYCGARGCFRACLEHLDRRGVLTRTPTEPYRRGRCAPTGKATREAAGPEVHRE